MKTLFLILFFQSFSISLNAQDYKIPAIEFESKSETPNFTNLLGINDPNCLIMSIGYSGYWQNGTISKFVVFQNDGKILKYDIYFKNGLDKPIVKKRSLIKKKYKFYWEFLSNHFTKGSFKIDNSKLNIEVKPEEENRVSTLVISDGTLYNFNIYQNVNYISYSSYSPESYIERKFPGYEERQKLVNLVTEFEELYDKN